MPAAAKGAEHIDAHDKGATFNKKVMAHVWARTFFLFTPGFRLDAPRRNCNGNANASKGSEATQANASKGSGNHSEVYHLEDLILFLLLMGTHIFSFHSRLPPGCSET